MYIKQKTGKIGENIACKYLNSNNYEIIERNFRCRQGEIDIIAFDTEKKEFVKPHIILFVTDIGLLENELISKYILEYMRFNDWDTFDVFWNNCSLNTWLNTEFLNGHFTQEEKNRILLNHETGKKVFLLSLKEVLKYLPTNQNRQTQATKWAFPVYRKPISVLR